MSTEKKTVVLNTTTAQALLWDKVQSAEVKALRANLVSAVTNRTYVAKRLQDRAEVLARSMTRLWNTVADGGVVNSLGEVQGEGLGIDLLCQSYQEAGNRVRAAVDLAQSCGALDRNVNYVL